MINNTLLVFMFFTDSSLNDQVHQTPFNILAKRGEEARIRCSHDIQNYEVILWYKRLENKQLQLLGYRYKDNTNPEPGTDVKLEMDGSGDKGENCTLTIKELNEKSSAVYFCAAKLPQYGVDVTAPTVKILRPSPLECRDQKKKEGKRRKTLVCVASGFYPDHVTVFWQLNGQNITDGVATDAAAKRNEITGLYSITSRLRLQAKTWFNPDNEFSCYVTFFNGTYTNYSTSIYSWWMGSGTLFKYSLTSIYIGETFF
uniref:Ig-like domain-containing protein n=1 Tax=Poecilia latipinna TaxID=48699 RepID=A0A3B3VWX0_9TELE